MSSKIKLFVKNTSKRLFKESQTNSMAKSRLDGVVFEKVSPGSGNQVPLHFHPYLAWNTRDKRKIHHEFWHLIRRSYPLDSPFNVWSIMMCNYEWIVYAKIITHKYRNNVSKCQVSLIGDIQWWKQGKAILGYSLGGQKFAQNFFFIYVNLYSNLFSPLIFISYYLIQSNPILLNSVIKKEDQIKFWAQ